MGTAGKTDSDKVVSPITSQYVVHWTLRDGKMQALVTIKG